MMKLTTFALSVFVLLPTALAAQTQATSAAQTQTASDHHADEAAIQQVMNRYYAAIFAHDGTALSSLFLPDANLWLNVLTDSAYARAQAKSATARKVRVGSYRDFAKLVSTTTKNFDPVHSHLVMHTDGTIAVLYFDFVFNVEGKANNRGSETWQLVKAADGWRIASIVHSSEPRAAVANFLYLYATGEHMADTRVIIEQAYCAFNRRDIDGALALMTEDVNWPKASEGGRVIGKEEISAYWTRQWREFDGNVEPLEITEEDGGRVRVRVHQLVRNLQGDVLSDSEVLHIFTVSNGLIAAMDLGDQADTTGPTAAFAHRS